MLIYSVFSVKPYLHDVSHARIAKEKASDPQLVSAAFAALRKTLGWIFPKSSRNIPSGP